MKTQYTFAAILSAATIAFAAPAFAGDCNYKKKTTAQTSYHTAAATDHTAVMGATIHQAGYNSGKTYAKGTIIDAAVATDDLSTLVAAVKAAGLVETLSGDGPFTVFAPTNAAFDALPAGTVETLLKPENKAKLTQILTTHVVAGNLSSTDIVSLVNANGGKAKVETLSGEMLTAKMWNGKLYLKDANGNKMSVQTADIMKGNGTVHVIDGVLLPSDKMGAS